MMVSTAVPVACFAGSPGGDAETVICDRPFASESTFRVTVNVLTLNSTEFSAFFLLVIWYFGFDFRVSITAWYTRKVFASMITVAISAWPVCMVFIFLAIVTNWEWTVAGREMMIPARINKTKSEDLFMVYRD